MILHISDLHFGTEKIECIKAIQQFCLLHKPEAIVVSGDLTQRAKPTEFRACRQFLDQLDIPYLVVPGNHDIPLFNLWQRLTQPFQHYLRYFGCLETVLETQHFYLIGLNSIRRRFHTKGHLSKQQIASVTAQLAQAPKQKLKFIVVHQPFYVPKDDQDSPLLARYAVKIWAEKGLDGLLHGHLHHAAHFNLNCILQLNAKKPVWEIHAGTATSCRLHVGTSNSLNTISAQGLIQHFVYDEKQEKFVLRER